MDLLAALFYYMAFASVVSALLAVTRHNPVHSMLWVLALFLHMAGIFLLLNAEFLAVVQIIIYAGAILIFYLFVLMLLDLPTETAAPRYGRHWPFAAAAGLSFAALGFLARLTPRPATEPLGYQGTLREVGSGLVGPFALPFEIVSVILLAAIVGAVVLARKRAAS